MIQIQEPLISCVMVTQGRLNLMVDSINCYLHQTYPKKNLFVLSQGKKTPNNEIRKYIDGLNRGDVHFFEAPTDLTLGALRNTSVELTTGDVVCQWDDDDLSHPERLATQYKVLGSNSSFLASMYCDFLKYYKTSGEIYWCDWSGEKIPQNRYICNTLMFYKKVFGWKDIVYPEKGPQCQVEEDLNILTRLLYNGQVGKVFAGWQFLYVYHGGNVYGIKHHNHTLNTSTGKVVKDREFLLKNQSLIFNTLRSVNIRQSVKIKSLHEDVLVYNLEKENHEI